MLSFSFVTRGETKDVFVFSIIVLIQTLQCDWLSDRILSANGLRSSTKWRLFSRFSKSLKEHLDPNGN